DLKSGFRERHGGRTLRFCTAHHPGGNAKRGPLPCSPAATYSWGGLAARRAGWLLWGVVVFGLYGAGLRHERFLTLQHDLDAGRWPGAVEAVRAYLTNDGDLRRTFAYAEAAPGTAAAPPLTPRPRSDVPTRATTCPRPRAGGRPSAPRSPIGPTPCRRS